ncbi:hypothetical protein PoB_002926500 [Plakobranchus ocellatus]|uniref:Uncharacterized protein n=1 Tax=Plakobranchus ocellatus TaxID=259542 RepID=A0AAV4A7F3_9GAST|nr:hypothetical protein PoB_002926500 [Plakobranchus ocellatus]
MLFQRDGMKPEQELKKNDGSVWLVCIGGPQQGDLGRSGPPSNQLQKIPCRFQGEIAIHWVTYAPNDIKKSVTIVQDNGIVCVLWSTQASLAFLLADADVGFELIK